METSPDRVAKLESLYQAVLRHPPEQRGEYLREACGNDEALRRELETRLGLEPPTDLFAGVVQRAIAAYADGDEGSPVMSGQRIGVYVLAERLGAGGMGEVFRAHDTRLRRDVAIKVLAPAFAADPERLVRLEREARLLASLNHPNIAAIYGLETLTDSGAPALILELIPGDTLAERIAAGPLPPRVALAYARQIIEALDAAHERGIIHRDLKPANVKVTPEGVIKVLDFGLARTIAPSGGDQSAALTATSDATREGVVMGTAAYMSPEQARGLPVDKRTDIWAFGCVLYEMLTGHAAFPGKTIPDTLAGVLDREPDWALLPAATPPAVRRLLERCLEKEAKRRVRDIGDAAMELDHAVTSPAKVTEARTQMSRWIWLLATTVVVAGLALGWTIVRVPPQPLAANRAVRLAVDPPAGTQFGADSGSAISPDGQMLAFVVTSSGGTSLWVRALNSLSARELPGTDAAMFPFWSPDGRSLGFFAAGKLKRIEVSGGLPVVICDVSLGRGGTWNGDGDILFNAVNDGPLLRVSASGGTPALFTTVDKEHGENSHRWPHFLPGGRRFLYFARNTALENSGVYLASMDAPHQKTLVLRSSTSAIYVPDRGQVPGHVLWVRDGTLMAQPFDPDQGHITGEPVNVAEGVAFGPTSRLAAVSASTDGTLVYEGTAVRQVQLTWYDRQGRQVETIGEPDEYFSLRISPNGERVAFTRGGDVWQMDFARGISTRVTFGGNGGLLPLWSPDSQRIAYSKGGPTNLFSRPTNGTGDEERLVESHDSLAPQDWSADGKFLLYRVNSNDLSSKTRFDLWVLPMTGNGKPKPFRSTPFREGQGQFSPDGKWVAYTSDESGRDEVYVQSFPPGGARLPVSSKGGDWVRWRKDGREMFYIAADRKLMAVTVQPLSGSLEFGNPQPLFTMPFTLSMSGDLAPYTYDVMPGGQRFLTLVPAGDAPSQTMTVTLNWQAELSTDKSLRK